ncbi:MAG: aminotransferase class I/II-fold pyridoxal phosphate-dependent enzyme, partial [Pseudomonadota bacterium]
GETALSDHAWIEDTRRRLETDSKRLSNLLKETGFSLEGRNGLFVCASYERAEEFASELARQHILVRRFPEMPGRLRFGLCADDAAFDRLSDAFSQVGHG